MQATGRPSRPAPERDSRCTAVKPYRCDASPGQRRRRDETNEETYPYRARRWVCGVATVRTCTIRFWHRLRSDTGGARCHADRERAEIHRQRSTANRAGPTDLHQHREDRHDSAASIQRRKAAIRTHPPDDPRAQDALCAISVSNLRLATPTANLEYLWQFDGLAQFGKHREGGRIRVPTS